MHAHVAGRALVEVRQHARIRPRIDPDGSFSGSTDRVLRKPRVAVSTGLAFPRGKGIHIGKDNRTVRSQLPVSRFAALELRRIQFSYEALDFVAANGPFGQRVVE